MVKINNKQHITKDGVVKNNPKKVWVPESGETVFDIYNNQEVEFLFTMPGGEVMVRPFNDNDDYALYSDQIRKVK